MPFTHEQPVVLRDRDAFGHVNNAVYLTYVENARVAFLAEVAGLHTVEQIGNVMASAKLDYLRPIAWSDTVSVARVGGKSFELSYELRTPRSGTVATVRTVQVAVDASGAAVPIPASVRRALEEAASGDERTVAQEPPPS
jgi:acyl-CoA thioester hydrolase